MRNCSKRKYTLFISLTSINIRKIFSHDYDPGNFQHRVYVFDADFGKYFKEKEKNGTFILRPLFDAEENRPLRMTEVGRFYY